jgi:putative transposase
MANKIRPELLDELLAGIKTQEAMFGRDGLLKQLSGALVERALQAELADHLEVERGGGESNRHNGKSRKTLQTEQGPTPIEVPRDRNATFEPQIVPKYATRVEGLDQKVLALYSRGLSTRDIQSELSELYGADISPTLISRVTDAVKEEITSWQGRPLEQRYAIVWLDALFVKMRNDGVVTSRAVYVAIGVTVEGQKEILGLWVEDTEGAKFWMRVLSELRTRGVRDILIACCDGLKGFPAAIEAVFPKTIVQTCIVHQVRNSLSFVSWNQRKKVAAALRMIYTAESEKAALQRLDEFETEWGKAYPMIARSWRANWTQLTPFLAFPQEIRRIIYTTNAIESLNFQLRKVIKTKGHFPSEESAIKLLYLALRNVERKWLRPPIFWRQARVQLGVFFGEERLTQSN